MSASPVATIVPSTMTLFAPTVAPTVAVQPVPMNIGTSIDPSEESILRFVIYIIVTGAILGFLVYLNKYVYSLLHLCIM
jgi:hypothetical protein